MNEAILDFTADDFREVFRQSIFDYLHENGINLSRIEDVFPRYEEKHIAHSINMALSMVVERIVDKLLLSQNVLTEEEIGTELESDFRIEVNPSTDKPTINAKYSLRYKKENLHFTIECQLELDEFYDNEKLTSVIENITSEVEKQLSK
nr:hypothetical protein [Neobacillus sp. Marseille-Q6967]